MWTVGSSPPPGHCEDYGHDLITGTPVEPTEYKAMNPSGKAIIKAAEYLPPHETPTDDHPFVLTTGRTIFHFHTRTKTGRAPELQRVAPDVWVEMSETAAMARSGGNQGGQGCLRSQW